jgi:hypothetical protein
MSLIVRAEKSALGRSVSSGITVGVVLLGSIYFYILVAVAFDLITKN